MLRTRHTRWPCALCLNFQWAIPTTPPRSRRWPSATLYRIPRLSLLVISICTNSKNQRGQNPADSQPYESYAPSCCGLCVPSLASRAGHHRDVPQSEPDLLTFAYPISVGLSRMGMSIFLRAPCSRQKRPYPPSFAQTTCSRSQSARALRTLLLKVQPQYRCSLL